MWRKAAYTCTTRPWQPGAAVCAGLSLKVLHGEARTSTACLQTGTGSARQPRVQGVTSRGGYHVKPRCTLQVQMRLAAAQCCL